MSGVGQDIKEVLADVGVSYNIVRDTRTIRGEYLKYVPNAQVTKPFIREFFLEAQISYDTKVVPGDIVYFVPTTTYYIVMNKTPYILENEVIRYDVVLYKSNVNVDIDRPSEVRDAQTYLYRTTYERVKLAAPALLSEPLFGASLETDVELGLIGIERGELYVPTSYDVRVLDRIRVSGTSEYYRAEVLHVRRFENVDVVELGEDVRPTTTTTTSSSTTTTTV